MRDLRQLKTRIPFETLKIVVDLAVDIGREGREGKPVGTLLVVGDHRKVLSFCRPMGFDPVRGYSRAERNLSDAKVREGIKEIAQIDGAFVVSSDATVVAAGQHIAAPRASDLTLPKGFGSRHWAAAEISRATSAIAIVVSQSSGTVRLFQNGESRPPHRTLPPPDEMDRVRPGTRRRIDASIGVIARLKPQWLRLRLSFIRRSDDFQ